MKVARISVENFRRVRAGTVALAAQSLLVGSNGVGKSTICEALDLTLGPERMFRRPVIDEYDFYGARYHVGEDGVLPQVRIEVVLTELSEAAQRHFHSKMRRWSVTRARFLDEEPPENSDTASSADTATAKAADLVAQADAKDAVWALPVLFLGRYDPEEDDFVGGTFFAHPSRPLEDLDEEERSKLGAGLKSFTRKDKQWCRFLYLRPNRIGSRALSFQRGSLLDTIVRLESQQAGPLWETALGRLRETVITDEASGFSSIRGQVRKRLDRFLNLVDGPDAVDLGVSELTREHLRDVLRLFIASQPGMHGVPFGRLSTGSLNLLVFALLTYIADLQGEQAVIFAMEEPEIALSPHAQRRLVDYVTEKMGQVIVTSHSPYVIEKFDHQQIVVLDRGTDGHLTGTALTLPADYKVKKYLTNRRQFAEAVLARAVLVVEGATEASLLPIVAAILHDDPSVAYRHLDLAGISIFNAGNDVSVPLYAPVFATLGKPVFGIHDTPNDEFDEELQTKTTQFTCYEVIPFIGVEDLLVNEVAIAAQRRFLSTVKGRTDYPGECGAPADEFDEAIRAHVRKLLKARKGSYDGYAALLITACANAAELPQTLVDFLIRIDTALRSSATTPDSETVQTGVDDDGA
ncbi:ATP-dependent nuclease [Allokutzneria oryzae]|uniref:ATP-dependent endonuclease n=1 Tax=Allokutzneria oryzae TaxID=1378989 RepID=A0ABV5ZPT2_9PSEU